MSFWITSSWSHGDELSVFLSYAEESLLIYTNFSSQLLENSVGTVVFAKRPSRIPSEVSPLGSLVDPVRQLNLRSPFGHWDHQWTYDPTNSLLHMCRHVGPPGTIESIVHTMELLGCRTHRREQVETAVATRSFSEPEAPQTLLNALKGKCSQTKTSVSLATMSCFSSAAWVYQDLRNKSFDESFNDGHLTPFLKVKMSSISASFHGEASSFKPRPNEAVIGSFEFDGPSSSLFRSPALPSSKRLICFRTSSAYRACGHRMAPGRSTKTWLIYFAADFTLASVYQNARDIAVHLFRSDSVKCRGLLQLQCSSYNSPCRLIQLT